MSMNESSLKVGGQVMHRGALHFVHAHYKGTCGRRIVQVSPRATTSGDAIVCNNVPLEELEEVKVRDSSEANA